MQYQVFRHLSILDLSILDKYTWQCYHLNVRNIKTCTCMYIHPCPASCTPYRSCILFDFGNSWHGTVFRPNRFESAVLFMIGIKKITKMTRQCLRVYTFLIVFHIFEFFMFLKVLIVCRGRKNDARYVFNIQYDTFSFLSPIEVFCDSF